MTEILTTIGVLFMALAMVAGAVGLGALFLVLAGEISSGRRVKVKKRIIG